MNMAVCVCPGDWGAGAGGAESVSGGGEASEPGGGAGSGESCLDQWLPALAKSPFNQKSYSFLPRGSLTQQTQNLQNAD